MGFRPLEPRTVRWRPVEDEGLEHLDIRPHDGGIEVRSVVIGARGGRPYGLTYSIDCDGLWRVRAFTIEASDGRRLSLASPVPGHWRHAGGQALPEFDGCIDIDLSGTPFTNTLPIRRLGLRPSEGTVELSMLYVPFDTLTPLRDGQRYTALAPRLFRYEASDRSFAVDLPLDEDGLVIDYPTAFQRA